MKKHPLSNGEPKAKPWKIIKGKARNVTISKWESGGRTYYCVWVPEREPPRYVTSNEDKIVQFATLLSKLPAKKALDLAAVPAEILSEMADIVELLKPILDPLEMSIAAGLNEYCRIKKRTGKLNLDELFNGLLAACPETKDFENLADRLRDIGGAIGKLAPILAPLKISITSGIEEYIAVKTQAGTQDLRQLLKEALTKPWVARSKTPIEDVANEFLDSIKDEQKVSHEYHKSHYYLLANLVEAVGGQTAIGDVTTKQLKSIVYHAKLAPRSKSSKRGLFLRFFHWCQLNQYLDYGQPTAADRLPAIKVPRKAPRILEPGEAKVMLLVLEDLWCLLYLALGLFTGVRHDELERMTWDMIKDDVIDIPANVSKTKVRRIIPLHRALRAWLAPFHGRKGYIMPTLNFQAKTAEFLKHCGQSGVPNQWEDNWLRQSFASYRLAETGKIVKTAKESGHSPSQLERDYLELSSESKARKYFASPPEACGKKDWNQRVKALLKGVPEVLIRKKNRTKGWKRIGKGPKPAASPEPPTGTKDSSDHVGGA